MFSKYVGSRNVLFLILSLSLIPIFAHAALTGPSVTGDAPTVPQAGNANGRLNTHGNIQVDVNGNPSPSGTTIFSGAQLTTPTSGGATVDLPGLGRFDLRPGTRVVLTFDATGIHVSLLYGCAVLTVNNSNASGSIQAPKGDAQQTTASQRKLDVCYKDGDAGLIPGPAGAGAAGGLFGLGTAATAVVIGGAATATAVLLALQSGGTNPSAVTPVF